MNDPRELEVAKRSSQRMPHARTPYDSAGAANSPSPEVRQAWEAGRDAAACLTMRVSRMAISGREFAQQSRTITPGPAAPPATKEKTAGAEKGGAN